MAHNPHCPVEATLELIGGKYKALILWHLSENTLRFSELRKAIKTATPKMLTQQLRELETQALVHREVYPVVPPRVEYSLTERGHSLVRVLDKLFPLNLTLQTLTGIAGHNGEIELAEYHPVPMDSFADFDREIEKCYTVPGYANKIQPSTLEGNVVRISDIIAYLGKDRQDADKIRMVDQRFFPDGVIGTVNSEIIHNLVVNIIENSYGKPYIMLDEKHFKAVQDYKRDNYAMIYLNEPGRPQLQQVVKPMLQEIYGQLLEDLRLGKTDSPIFKHHIDYVNNTPYERTVPYGTEEPNQIVVDYIASMTDDYLVDLHRYLFPTSGYDLTYTGYFVDLK